MDKTGNLIAYNSVPSTTAGVERHSTTTIVIAKKVSALVHHAVDVGARPVCGRGCQPGSH